MGVSLVNRDEALERILDRKVVAVIRMTDTAKVLRVIEAIRKGGVDCVEITHTVPNAQEMIKKVVQIVGKDGLVGAGTVLDPEAARQSILAGAQFVVGPTLNAGVVRVAHQYDVVVIPGAFTPTEIFRAWDMGADIVKVFPATALGPQYLRDIRGPLPQIRLLPTGGVTIENAGEFIKAGACCVGIGTNLLQRRAIEANQFDELTERARRLVANIQSASGG